MSSNTPSDDAEEPVAWMVYFPSIPTTRFYDEQGDEFCEDVTEHYDAEVTPLYTRPEPEAEPVGYQWLHSGHFRKQIPKNANAIEWYPLYLHPPKPVESEAETIETLKAENFKLASGQCTEGGPWGDQGGTPYCKYAARKPMSEKEAIELCPFTREEFKAGFLTGIRYAEKYHDITDAEL